MAKKEIKKQTIEEILAEHTPTSDAVKSAVQRYNEEKKKQQEQIIINTLGAIDCIIWDLVDNLRKIRAEEKRAQQCLVDVAAAKDAYLADPDLEVLAQGTSQGRHQPVPLYRVTGTRLSESKQIFKLRASLVFMTRG